jgi:AraC-like DNA-binding protein
MASALNDKVWRDYRSAVARGELSRAHLIALKAAQLWEERDELKPAGLWRRAVSSTLYYQGKYGEAAVEAQRSAEIQSDLYERARALIFLGETSALSLKLDVAFITLGKAEEIARSFRDDTFLNARVYTSKAVAYNSAGDIDQAVVDAEKGAALDRQGGLLLKIAVGLNTLGFTLARARRPEKAEQHLLSALHLFEKGASLFYETGAYDSLGYAYMLMGHHHDAERLLQKCAGTFERLSNNAELAVALLHLSELHQRMRQYHKARDEAARALRLATQGNLASLAADARDLLLILESDANGYSRITNPNVQRVGDLIRNNLHQKLPLKEMALATNLSSSHLSHLFKTETGTSPAKYVKSTRMNEARHLLETTLLSVKEITFRVGLIDESHFVRDFKKAYGLPPAQYRARFRTQNKLTSRVRKSR